MPRLFRLFLLCLLMPATALGEDALTLGIFAYRPKAVMEEKFGPLAGYLTEALPGGRVRLEILTQEEMEVALAAGRLDFVFTNPSHFVLLRHTNGFPAPSPPCRRTRTARRPTRSAAWFSRRRIASIFMT